MPASPATTATALSAAAARLVAAGIPPDDARLDARVLLAHVLGLPSPAGLGLRLDDALSEAAAEGFAALIERRIQREPVGRILGRRGFWTLDLALGPDTLEPRPDTETVVAALLERLTPTDAPWHLLDLGTGTGCILLALLAALPAARGLGVDRSPGAVETARANAATHGLAERATLRVADWRGGATALGVSPASLDAVVSNPPYIPSATLPTLAPEVRAHDPVLALDGGADGLDAYRTLVPLARHLLRPGGWLALEVGAGQAEDVSGLMNAAGFSPPAIARDLGGHGRCVIAAQPPKKGGPS
ncbi:peptide chain release factor N(5)-glutamine methyltransferase [Roseospira visakhapatnamensis]|uniref:Release factor glutamine methyltransferase n=1 Tax=Roseospira visakhapatnamensis TaxID=390880 RepID=A0A7W6RBY6_9PROT|nr:peptide chain release factor N(5)-glutamine methyltransferase [Roseospira visakhapatnamensis]MBB4265627.1 release factor glutamine methyltransferase [Roseospira visakhapatnamensis]